ncbi:hypothetical protein EV715DRAFT_286203 [Schizophyllum commune]
MDIDKATAKMGEYMLKGWVLTDKTCSTVNCPVPLMRSPNGQTPVVHFCTRCHGGPEGIGAPSAAASTTSASTSIASASHISRASTPPTELSNESSFEDFVLPPETEESRRRREQSDTASTEIGKRLLKGWAMLADECPSTNCWGVPLVRPPKAGGEKDPRMECVICGNVYISERSAAGVDTLVAQSSPSVTATPAPAATSGPSALPRGAVVQEYGINANYASTPSLFASYQPTDSVPPRTAPPPHPAPPTFVSEQAPSNVYAPSDPTGPSSVKASIVALELSLKTLSQKLTSLCSSGGSAASISSTAEAIDKAAHALQTCKQLEWSLDHDL